MKIEYKSYEIEIIDNNHYTLGSSDNKNSYRLKYYNGQPSKERIYTVSKYGIRIIDSTLNIEISSAILCENGGATSIHKDSFYIEDDKLWICICDKVYCLNIPTLEIVWHKRYDWATHFSLNPFHDDFLIHGELEIFRISKSGDLKWRFGASDIFINAEKGNHFEIKDKIISVRDWNGKIYKIDENGKELM